MNKKIVAIDIDGTLIPDIGDDWWAWLDRNFQYNEYYLQLCNSLFRNPPYDLTECFDIPPDQDGFEWWSDLKYKNYSPTGEYFVDLLYRAGYEILLVSKVTGNHAKSKTKWCNKWFPYAKVILTEHKEFVKCDYIIDDSNYVLNKIDKSVFRIKFNNPYTFKEALDTGVFIVEDMGEAYKLITGESECLQVMQR